MTAFLFSGQGSQYTGMGKELLEANPEFSFIYDKASEILGYDLKKVTFAGSLIRGNSDGGHIVIMTNRLRSVVEVTRRYTLQFQMYYYPYHLLPQPQNP